MPRFVFLIFISQFLRGSTVITKSNQDEKSDMKDSLLEAIIKGTPVLGPESRSFFVLITTGQLLHRCGGTIVDQFWVLTAAHCVDDSSRDQITIHVGDFTSPNKIKTRLGVMKVILHERYQPGDMPLNDLALLKTASPMHPRMVLPLCEFDFPFNTPLTACGLGTTERTHIAIPEALMETVFLEYKPLDRYIPTTFRNAISCREDNICSVAVPHSGSICIYDDGGPLFTTKCGSSEAMCLYGVSSYYFNWKRNAFEKCNSESFFANVPYFRAWIMHKIDTL